MNKLPVILIVLSLTMAVGSSKPVTAGSCFSSTQCQGFCDEYCTSKNSVCQKATLYACNSNGQQTCSVLCKSGSGYSPTCTCSSGGGGSPIFKKVPIGPPPEPRKESNKSSETAQPAKNDTGQCPGSKQPS
jgi:hypothetical protein